jgi:hypothetical protein
MVNNQKQKTQSRSSKDRKLKDVCSRSKKVKTVPLQAWTGPQGSRRSRLPDFKTVGT